MPTLLRATPEQHLERDVCTYQAWGDKLTLDQYLAREAQLRRHPFSKNMSCWL